MVYSVVMPIVRLVQRLAVLDILFFFFLRKLQVQVGHPVVDSAPIINLGRGQSHRLCL